jgi:hypothetical protein
MSNRSRGTGVAATCARVSGGFCSGGGCFCSASANCRFRISDPTALLNLILSFGKKDELVADESETDDVAELTQTLKRVKNGGEYLGDFPSRLSCLPSTAARSCEQQRPT